MGHVILRFNGHPATFRGSAEMLKRWNPECIVQRPVQGVVLVLGVESADLLKGPMDEWDSDPKLSAQLADQLGLSKDEADTDRSLPPKK